MARIARADVGPLAAYADGYRELLAGLGYTPSVGSGSCARWVGSAIG